MVAFLGSGFDESDDEPIDEIALMSMEDPKSYPKSDSEKRGKNS